MVTKLSNLPERSLGKVHYLTRLSFYSEIRLHHVTGSHVDVLRIKEKWRNLKEVYADSDREDGFRSHGSMIRILSCCLRVMIDCLGIFRNIVFICTCIVRKSFLHFINKEYFWFYLILYFLAMAFVKIDVCMFLFLAIWIWFFRLW